MANHFQYRFIVKNTFIEAPIEDDLDLELAAGEGTYAWRQISEPAPHTPTVFDALDLPAMHEVGKPCAVSEDAASSQSTQSCEPMKADGVQESWASLSSAVADEVDKACAATEDTVSDHSSQYRGSMSTSGIPGSWMSLSSAGDRTEEPQSPQQADVGINNQPGLQAVPIVPTRGGPAAPEGRQRNGKHKKVNRSQPHCPHCGLPTQKNFRFCTWCGLSLS
eukprot:TRINITY_DN17740_c0_g1_i1.p1 TRINITY_DN17740_c0_g1~~TRINITY_DN17740_c0_g1_i1.p1  ORF type:complete len:252 (+),score=37.69 TRINITY_DN17740_c0_g1_i1:94-756(+)